VAWTIEDLIASVKRRALIPTAQSTFTTSDFIAIANEELQSYVVPLITSQREDYFVAHYDVTLSTASNEYRLPTRAIGQALREVSIVNSQSQLLNLARISREELAESPSAGFYLDGNVLMLAVTNPAQITQMGQTLRMTYHQRPNTLVATTAVGTVATIGAGTGTLTGTPSPSIGGAVDLLRGRPGFECLDIDSTSVAVSGAGFTFSGALPSDFVAGDVIAASGQTNYPQIPVELHPLLAQRVAVKCLEAMGDKEQIDVAGGVLARMETDAVKLLAPRVAGSVERIINRESPFRSIW